MGGKHRKRPDHDNTNTAVAAAMVVAAASGLFIPRADDTAQNLKPVSGQTQPSMDPVHVCDTKHCDPLPDAVVTVSIAPIPTTTTTVPPAVVTREPPQAPAPPPTPDPPPQFVPGQNGHGWEAMWDVIQRNFPDAQLMSGYRTHTCGQYHCKGLAIDIAASPARMREIDRWIYETYGSQVSQLIHGPGPYNILDGRAFDYGYGTLSEHYDHVHWAMAGSA